MKAITFDARHGGFRDCEMPVPALRPGDVRIRVAAASFNPVDCQRRQAIERGEPAASPILGRDLSGVIEAVAQGVDGWAAGDPVYAYIGTLASSGAYAESVSLPSELVALKPASLTHEQAAAVPVVGVTATLALRKVQAAPPSSLFIAGGAGGVG